MKTTRVIAVVSVGVVLAMGALVMAKVLPSHSIDGKWRCQTTLRESGYFGRVSTEEFSLSLRRAGLGTLRQVSNGEEVDRVTGAWRCDGRFLTIDRENGGFAALRILSSSDSRMAVVNRAGVLLEFVRIP